MTDPSTWALRCQVFRETDLYDGFSVKGRSELFFPSTRNLRGRKSHPGNSAGLLLRGLSHFIAERVRTVFSDVVMVMIAVFPSACLQGVMAHCCSTPCFFFPYHGSFGSHGHSVHI